MKTNDQLMWRTPQHFPFKGKSPHFGESPRSTWKKCEDISDFEEEHSIASFHKMQIESFKTEILFKTSFRSWSWDELNRLGPSWMVLTHGNVTFVILESSAFQKHSICWVFQAFFCSTFFYTYFATRPRPALTSVI